MDLHTIIRCDKNMKKIMRSIPIIFSFKFMKTFTILTFCISLLGCSPFKLFNNINIDSIIKSDKKNYVSEMGEEILRCIKEKDKKGISSLYCQKVENTEYLSKQIDYIFDYIDKNGGLIIKNGSWNYPSSHGSYDGSGSKSIQYFSCKYSGNVYINNIQYDLRFTAYQKLKKHQEYEGVITISIVEHIDSKIIDKAYKYREENDTIKRIFLGFDLFNFNYYTLQYMSILPKELNENEEYELLDSLEDD